MNESVVVGAAIVGAGFPESDPAVILGSRGLRYKDEATRLALAATELALAESNRDVAGPTAVIASSNLGNLDTVCRVAGAAPGSGVRSAMDLPNASSNVIASSIAIRYGLRGPNLMLCSGSTSGLDALRWARVLLAARRAARVVVVGVEVDNPVTARFAVPRGPGLFHGAACVILEQLEGTTARARVGGLARDGAIAELLDGVPLDRWYSPDSGSAEGLPDNLVRVPRIDLAARVGSASGALGVLQAASACAEGGTSLLTAGGGARPLAACLITPPAMAYPNSHTTSGERIS